MTTKCIKLGRKKTVNKPNRKIVGKTTYWSTLRSGELTKGNFTFYTNHQKQPVTSAKLWKNYFNVFTEKVTNCKLFWNHHCTYMKSRHEFWKLFYYQKPLRKFAVLCLWELELTYVMNTKNLAEIFQSLKVWVYLEMPHENQQPVIPNSQ